MLRKYPKPNPGDIIAGCELLEELPKHPTRGDARWRYRCTICGATQDCFEFSLWKRKAVGCGCLNTQALAARQLKDETGNRIGHVEFLCRITTPKGKKDAWYRCKCHNCGKEWDTSVRTVRHSPAEMPSCGCVKDEKFHDIATRHYEDYRESLGLPRHEMITPQTKRDRYKLAKEYSPLIFKRDAYTCACCGKQGGKLHAHHILSYSRNPTLRFSERNLITVCQACHLSVVHGGSTKQNPDGNLEWQHHFQRLILTKYEEA